MLNGFPGVNVPGGIELGLRKRNAPPEVIDWALEMAVNGTFAPLLPLHWNVATTLVAVPGPTFWICRPVLNPYLWSLKRGALTFVVTELLGMAEYMIPAAVPPAELSSFTIATKLPVASIVAAAVQLETKFVFPGSCTNVLEVPAATPVALSTNVTSLQPGTLAEPT